MVEIYFRDLSEEKQKEVLEEAGISTPEEGNYDVFPIAVFEVEASDPPD